MFIEHSFLIHRADVPDHDRRIVKRSDKAVAIGAKGEGGDFDADIRTFPKPFAGARVPDPGDTAPIGGAFARDAGQALAVRAERESEWVVALERDAKSFPPRGQIEKHKVIGFVDFVPVISLSQSGADEGH